MNKSKKTLILGASENPARYSYMALQALSTKGHPVVAIGRRPGQVEDVAIQTGQPEITDVDTVTLYLNKVNQKDYYDYILSLKPKRIIFNPGAENPELAALANAAGILSLNACTLVLLSTGQF